MSQLPIRLRCSCGLQKVHFQATKSANKINPRRCECSFCIKHNLTYVSDSDGQVEIESNGELMVLTCGSEQAKFLMCTSCKTMLGAYIPDRFDHIRGRITLNASLWSTDTFGAVQTVALSQLTPEEKMERWSKLLTPCVLSVSPNALFVYGTLQPEQSNHYQVSGIKGAWRSASIQAQYHEAGWGMTQGFPGMILAEPFSTIKGSVLISDELSKHWARLDEFEGMEYIRQPCFVQTQSGEMLAQGYFVKK